MTDLDPHRLRANLTIPVLVQSKQRSIAVIDINIIPYTARSTCKDSRRKKSQARNYQVPTRTAYWVCVRILYFVESSLN